MTHTPGPWHYEDWTYDKARTEIVIGPEGMGHGVRPVARLIGHAAATRKGKSRDPVSITEHEAANARLIAAAPDLLAALRYVEARLASVAMPSGHPNVSRAFADLRDVAKTALAKAGC